MVQVASPLGSGTFPSSPPDAEKFFNLAECGDPESSPGDKALFDEALSFQKGGNYQKAIAYYTKAIEIRPQVSDAYINRGAAYESTGDLDLALQDLNIALGMGPRSEAYHIRGHVYFRKGDFGQAVLDLSEAIRLDSGNANAYIADAFTYRGHSYRHMSCYDHAIRDYRKALALAPSNPKAIEIRPLLNRGAVNGHLDLAPTPMSTLASSTPCWVTTTWPCSATTRR